MMNPFNPVEIKKTLQNALHENGYDYSDAIVDSFIQYLHLLFRWNDVFNLTAIRDPNEMVWHHMMDSLSISPYLKGKRIVDVGSGAGLPGIPLAITHPDKTFFLLESHRKKTHFLNQVIIDLGLNNVEVIHSRAELFHPDHCFEMVLSRAFSSLKNILLLTEHLICPQGEFLCMKGNYPLDEIKELPDQFKVIEVHEIKIKGFLQNRCLVRMKV